MKTAIALLATGLLFMLSGCRAGQPTADRSEILIRHLLRRNSDLDNEITKRWIKCLQEQNAMLRGEHVPNQSDAQGRSDRRSQGLLDAEESIELHNQRHPESPQADIKDLIRLVCGDCTRERAIRDQELKEEAQKYSGH